MHGRSWGTEDEYNWDLSNPNLSPSPGEGPGPHNGTLSAEIQAVPCGAALPEAGHRVWQWKPPYSTHTHAPMASPSPTQFHPSHLSPPLKHSMFDSTSGMPVAHLFGTEARRSLVSAQCSHSPLPQYCDSLHVCNTFRQWCIHTTSKKVLWSRLDCGRPLCAHHPCCYILIGGIWLA